MNQSTEPRNTQTNPHDADPAADSLLVQAAEAEALAPVEPMSPRYEASLRRLAAAPADTPQAAAGRQRIAALLGEVDRLRAELARYVGLEPTQAEEMTYLRAENDRLEARVAVLERPEIERQRNALRDSYQQLAAQARDDGDYTGEADVLQLLADREEQWVAEGAGRALHPDPASLPIIEDYDDGLAGYNSGPVAAAAEAGEGQ